MPRPAGPQTWLGGGISYQATTSLTGQAFLVRFGLPEGLEPSGAAVATPPRRVVAVAVRRGQRGELLLAVAAVTDDDQPGTRDRRHPALIRDLAALLDAGDAGDRVRTPDSQGFCLGSVVAIKRNGVTFRARAVPA